MRLGAHVSIQGGLERAVERAKLAGCDVMQIFTKSSGQWKARELTDEEIGRFRERLQADGVGEVSAHGSYLINLASPDELLYRRSIDALIDEVARCERIGIGSLIVHPGAHVGSGGRRGIRRIARALNEVHSAFPRGQARILIETAAGQGSMVGSRFEEIADIIASTRAPERLHVCFDTCHVFASGYDIRSEAGYEATFAEFDRLVGIGRIGAFHLNDSRSDLASRVDRHQHIGKGWIGLEAFRLLLNDSRFASVPMYLETPKGADLREDVENLAVLRALFGDVSRKTWAPPSEHDRRLGSLKSKPAAEARSAKPASRQPKPGPRHSKPDRRAAEPEARLVWTAAPRRSGLPSSHGLVLVSRQRTRLR